MVSRRLQAILLATAVLLPTIVSSAWSQEYRAPRTAYGTPDLNGIWQALGSAHWDVRGHEARMGPVVELGALGSVPAGQGVVVGGEIPYQDWAAEKQKENQSSWMELDPAIKCFMPGIPRATYMPFPFQIVQSEDVILMAYEFASASRVVYIDRPDFESPADNWMGHSLGRWEGETLVIDVTDHVAGHLVRQLGQLPQRRARGRRALHRAEPVPPAV